MLNSETSKPWFQRTETDPDRFVNFGTPGSQEWWYFDAISSDGKDAIVFVWYASLPFDPEYGVQTLRHLRNPSKNPAPNPLDHCGIGVHWYRDGKTLAYALNVFKADSFDFMTNPLRVAVDSNILERDDLGYTLNIKTPAVDGKSTIEGRFRFVPAAGTVPLTQNLGTPESVHEWVLVAGDCQVQGDLSVLGDEPQSLRFDGRGYHDHNAGSEEIRLAMKDWGWGRFHQKDQTYVYYFANSHHGATSSLVIQLVNGTPSIETDTIIHAKATKRTKFGLRYPGTVALVASEENVSKGALATIEVGKPVDDGPFYMRWISTCQVGTETMLGIAEWLETKNLHRPWFNWMIPYRLKRPVRS